MKKSEYWYLPFSRECFCFEDEKTNNISTSIWGSIEKSNLKWDIKNYDKAIELLRGRLNNMKTNESNNRKKLSKMFHNYSNSYLEKKDKNRNELFKKSILYFISKDYYCKEIMEIDESIRKNIPKVKQKYGIVYANLMLLVLKNSFEFGVKEKYLTKNPIDYVISDVNDLVESELNFSEEQVKLLLNQASNSYGHIYKDIIFLISNLGLRLNEVMHISSESIDYEATELRIISHSRSSLTKQSIRVIDYSFFENSAEITECLKRLQSNIENKELEKIRIPKIRIWLRNDLQKLNIYKPRKGFTFIRAYAIRRFLESNHTLELASNTFGTSIANIRKYKKDI